MKVFKLKRSYFYNKNTVLKTIFLLKILLFGLFSLNAQEKSNILLKIETGILWTPKSANPGFPWFNGFFLHLEPKLKSSSNTFIGLRIGASINEQKDENYQLLQFYQYSNPNNGIIQFTNPDNGSISIVPTFDYYFIEKKYQPYFGVGIGYYFLTNFTDVSPRDMTNPPENLEVSVNNQIGFLFRGGLNIGKLIVGLELNYIPKSEIKIPNEQIIGTVNNSNIRLSIGYAIGVGRN